MANINDVFGSGSSLKASDLQGRTVTVTIETVNIKQFDDGNKLILAFAGKDKVLICNKTNANRIAEKLGGDYERWAGNQISLHSERVEFQGSIVDGIRVVLEQAPQGGTATGAPPAAATTDADLADSFG